LHELAVLDFVNISLTLWKVHIQCSFHVHHVFDFCSDVCFDRADQTNAVYGLFSDPTFNDPPYIWNFGKWVLLLNAAVPLPMPRKLSATLIIIQNTVVVCTSLQLIRIFV